MQNPQSSEDRVDKLFSSELQLDNSEHYKRILHENNINTISELSEMEAMDLQMIEIPIEIGSKLIEKARQDTQKTIIKKNLSNSDDSLF
jgi:hypothetical protein